MTRTLALLLVLLSACTTSFEVDQLIPRADATMPTDSTVDAPPPDREPADAPSPDVTQDLPSACGVENAPCCSGDATPSSCNAGLVCSGGVCARCPGTLAACDGFCVDITSNASNCGLCGRACAEGQGCVAGSCVLSCAPGLVPCGMDCAQRLSDPMNCGSCGRVCIVAHATAACAGGVCGPGQCDPGFGDCDGNRANGCETSTTDDLANCGACGAVCAPSRAATSICSSGVCRVLTCRMGYADCDGDAANGCEVDLNTNAAHCGSCPNVCPGGGACSAGRCQTSSCPSGSAECMPDSVTCETNVTSDPMNCGACGNVCSLPNAMSQCARSTCAVTACNGGYGDCDMMAANGCETDTRASLSNCGACGAACNLANASGACVGGRCAIAACNDGYGDCDANPANGCETDLNASPANCGACASACTAQNATASCVAGRCGVGVCNAGFADCDMNPANGCEADTATSDSNCGACGTVCALPNAASSCAMGVCTLGACRDGFADCDMNPANGCEVDLRTDAAHCGACATSCVIANGMPACAAGRCAVGTCNMGFADCDMNPANGCEVDLTSSSQSCGRCGNACGSVQICSAGTCRTGCASGLTMCGSSCVDTRVSVSNCGGCGRMCPARPNASASCAGGTCGIVCNTNFGNCDGDLMNGCETDLRISTRHCGGCGRGCPSGEHSTPVCSMSTCGLSCSAGYSNCDGNASNGCESRLAEDPNNCSRCGNRCVVSNATAACLFGACIVGTCNSGWGNCNLLAEGCETNLNTDRTSCGRCGRVCLGTQTCMSGSCR